MFDRGLLGRLSLNFACGELGEAVEGGNLFSGGTGVNLVPLPWVVSKSAVKIGSCTGVTASDLPPDVPGRRPSRLPVVTGRAAVFMPSRSDSPVSANDTAVVGLELNVPACSRALWSLFL